MDRHNGFVAALRPEPAGGAAGDEGPPDQQRDDAAAALCHLHAKGEKEEVANAKSVYTFIFMTYFTQKSVI